jgi:PAS domain S-box-containing protein/diguanylate cyclase (GGDEF)-like protein
MERTDDRLKVLLVEDSDADAELMLRALRDLRTPFEHARVATEQALRRALAEYGPDVVLSDFSMPGFSGQQALAIVHEHDPGMPFLFVSGTIGEELAIDALQRGAVDYVLKDNLRRLGPAVERALRNAREQQERRSMERALRESEERFRSIVEHSRDWIWEMDTGGRLRYSNPAVERILGHPLSSLLGGDALRHLFPEDRPAVEARLAELMARKAGWTGWRLRWCARDGRVRTLDSTGTPLLDEHGALTGYRGIDHDITELLEQQARIRHLARLHAILGGVGNSLLRIRDRERLLDDLCRVVVHEGGFSAAAVGLAVDGESGPGRLAIANARGDQGMLECLRRLDRLEPEAQANRPGVRVLEGADPLFVRDLEGEDGTAVPEPVRGPLLEAGIRALALLPLGEPRWGVLGMYAREPLAFDEDERELLGRLGAEIGFGVDFIAKSERLEFLAYHNPVSGLPNRPALHLRMQPWLEREPAVLAMLDIERFSAINESRGRDFGDRLLRLAGERLQSLVGSAGHVAHPEADAFALVYRAAGPVETEIERLEGLLDEFEREPFEIGEETLLIDMRAGLALFPDHAADAESLERNAMAALSDGTRRGLRIHAFDDEMRGRAARRLGMEQDLRRAIEAGEFELHYQPKFEARQQRLVGAEALLRWRHPQRGLVSPGEFIPILEDTGLIVAVGRWVMAEALRTALAWPRGNCATAASPSNAGSCSSRMRATRRWTSRSPRAC